MPTDYINTNASSSTPKKLKQAKKPRATPKKNNKQQQMTNTTMTSLCNSTNSSTTYTANNNMTTVATCAGCDRPILDQYLYNVLDRVWHQSCIQCTDCKLNLNEKCFSREGKLFCKDDFFR